ncbi:MAG: hypothetical protein LH614_04555 [Pyrinomonadaceae bacterium]|nr:hypothetical protein [Pyrinomonadaceae bacterium]
MVNFSRLENLPIFSNRKMEKTTEFCLIVEGSYFTVEEAIHALHDPFIEEFVEENGRFRIQNFENIQAVSGIPLGDLEIALVDDEVFEISCRTSPLILNRRKAELLAETLRRQAMFDEISVEPLSINLSTNL